MSNDEVWLKALVAQIIDEYQVALNVGSEHNVKEGADVTLWRTVKVTDPVSKEALGDVRLPKVHLRVTQVEPRFCLARVTDSVSKGTESLFPAVFGRPLVRIVQGRIGDSIERESVNVEIGEDASVSIGTKDDLPF